MTDPKTELDTPRKMTLKLKAPLASKAPAAGKAPVANQAAHAAGSASPSSRMPDRKTDSLAHQADMLMRSNETKRRMQADMDSLQGRATADRESAADGEPRRPKG